MKKKNNYRLIAKSYDIYGDGNFLQGCLFSPDGLCILTNTVSDCKLRLYNTPQLLTSIASSTPIVDDNDKNDDNNNNTNNTNNNNDDTTTTNDTTIHHKWKTILSSNSGDTVRSYTWYPQMNSNNPSTCCFLAAARDQPIHLYDAYSGLVRASYRPYNGLDEMESASVVEFSTDGQKIFTTGFRTDRTIHIFDTTIPGRYPYTILRLGKTRKSNDGQKGIISCLCNNNNDHNLVAIGTYAPGSIYLYDIRVSGAIPTGTILNGTCIVGHGKSYAKKLISNSNKKRQFTTMNNDNDNNDDNDEQEDQQQWFSSAKMKWFQSRARCGVTQVMFSPIDSHILYSASRRSDTILSWDIRMLSNNNNNKNIIGCGIASYETKNNTNQRLQFDIDSNNNMLYVPGQDKCVRIYNLQTGKLYNVIDGFDDVVNGVSIYNNNNTVGKNNSTYLAVATGSRKFPTLDDNDHDDNEDDNILDKTCNNNNNDSSQQPPGYLSLYDITQ